MVSSKKITEMFKALSPKRKEKVTHAIYEKFGVGTQSSRNAWFYSGKIPDDKIEGCHKIVSEELKEQLKEIQSLIDVI
ncbi:hypothetical protein OKE68_02600 [Riemerella anatipestifer]|uniref:Uncharacterized protein n=1 Tax=Riemerella anatipestifer TaxID=34085 RepID=A0AAP3AKA1_RIEAN|nr:hypothetical protein [Riemerella anatipestifer]MBT0572465.1 hypothetical protein [Riemerella anatipestifer]MCW0489598.1 hypothetical protein [Riemerella anatipestifer]MCW0523207.1 hypothetical protein [Riemerella anatipestifer]MDR7796137.1 hypothetical protein [Riemerella anatipestifer]MDY3432478.1 hypothetical protein [Riemerella anatipestifer]